jgi:hypothetical protein
MCRTTQAFCYDLAGQDRDKKKVIRQQAFDSMDRLRSRSARENSEGSMVQEEDQVDSS